MQEHHLLLGLLRTGKYRRVPEMLLQFAEGKYYQDFYELMEWH